MEKICSNCKIVKLYNEFYKDLRRPCGLQSQCKECFCNQHKEFHKKKEWKEWSKNNWQKNKEKIYKRHQDWQKTKEGKEYLKKYRQTEGYKKYRRKFENEYCKKDIPREKDRILYEKYRSKKISSSDNTVNYESISKLQKEQNNKCNICNIDFKERKRNIDHIIPISKGGKHTAKNIQLLCWLCNTRKSNR